MMKRAITILLVVMTAVFMLQGVASNQLDFAGISGSEGSQILPGSDTKKLENKIAEALACLKTSKNVNEVNLSEVPVINPVPNSSNSGSGSVKNSSLNNSLANISQNSSPDNSTLPSLPTGNANAGASTRGNFKGFYGMTASRHEIGKSSIDSGMFLSGNFEMEKSVRFQDQGF